MQTYFSEKNSLHLSGIQNAISDLKSDFIPYNFDFPKKLFHYVKRYSASSVNYKLMKYFDCSSNELVSLKDLNDLLIQFLREIVRFHLVRLDSFHCHQSSLNVEKMCNVISFQCYDNKLENLHGIQHFTKLKFLNCSTNNLRGRLPEIKNLKHLQKLNCSGNFLTSSFIGKTLSLMHALKILDCSNNDITCLKGISKLEKLEQFSCNSNPLDVDSINYLQFSYRLKNLQLKNTPIDTIKGIPGSVVLFSYEHSHLFKRHKIEYGSNFLIFPPQCISEMTGKAHFDVLSDISKQQNDKMEKQSYIPWIRNYIDMLYFYY